MEPVKNKDPLHGITLKMILTDLVAWIGWQEMARAVEIRCFMFDPTINSSLKFLRRTPWARKKVEQLYLNELSHHKQGSKEVEHYVPRTTRFKKNSASM